MLDKPAFLFGCMNAADYSTDFFAKTGKRGMGGSVQHRGIGHRCGDYSGIIYPGL